MIQSSLETMPQRTESLPRELGRVDSGLAGPLVIVIGGMHGNEPAGVAAASRVFARLEEDPRGVCGRLIALTGNRAALAAEERFLTRDFNRVWSDDEVTAMRDRNPVEDDPEGAEQRDLLAILERNLADHDGPAVVLDLHTTSSGGAPFALSADTVQNRNLAVGLPIPLILGLEEGIEGPLLSYLADRGVPSLVVEGGQHDDPATEEHLVAAIWLVLESSGALSPGRPELEAARRALGAAAEAPPKLCEIEHVHRIAPGDDYRTAPGFENFDAIEVGQVIGHDRHGPVRAPASGLMLMPLYQAQGQDGYFLCRSISAGWLRFSEACRKSGLESLLPSLPGVRKHHTLPRALVVEQDASPIVLRVLCHFGYRKQVAPGVYVRRPERGES